jgi:hypothetical protein
MAAYYACKAYVLSFSQAIAEELRGTRHRDMPLPRSHGNRLRRSREYDSYALSKRLPVANAASVARAGCSGMLRGRDLVIPGFYNNLIALGPRLSPRRLLIWISRRTIE